jgi:hypothetical protein
MDVFFSADGRQQYLNLLAEGEAKEIKYTVPGKPSPTPLDVSLRRRVSSA